MSYPRCDCMSCVAARLARRTFGARNRMACHVRPDAPYRRARFRGYRHGANATPGQRAQCDSGQGDSNTHAPIYDYDAANHARAWRERAYGHAPYDAPIVTGEPPTAVGYVSRANARQLCGFEPSPVYDAPRYLGRWLGVDVYLWPEVYPVVYGRPPG